MNTEEKQKEFKQLVLARLSTIPTDALLSIGKFGTFSRNQALKEIEEESETGKLLIKIQIRYLQKLKEGILYGKAQKTQQI